jgi:hypothetical protein
MTELSKNTQVPQCDKTDVKCRFFAQYWGQLYEFKNTKTKWRVNEGAFPLEKEGNERLILTDLKNITDEDAVKIAETFGMKEELLFVGKFLCNGMFDNSADCEENVLFNSNAKAVDYLRSKGYAVPFMEYSVEDLVSFDWLRLV